MKKPLFDEFERSYISRHYNNKIINPSNIIIEQYEFSKAQSKFKKVMLKTKLFVLMDKLIEWLSSKL